MSYLIKITEDVYIGRNQLNKVRAITICPLVGKTMMSFTDGKLLYTRKAPKDVADIIEKEKNEA